MNRAWARKACISAAPAALRLLAGVSAEAGIPSVGEVGTGTVAEVGILKVAGIVFLRVVEVVVPNVAEVGTGAAVAVGLGTGGGGEAWAGQARSCCTWIDRQYGGA